MIINTARDEMATFGATWRGLVCILNVVKRYRGLPLAWCFAIHCVERKCSVLFECVVL